MTKTLNDEIKKLRTLLATAFQELPKPDKFDAELKIENEAVGEKAEIINQDGTLSPAPDGEYKYNEDTIVIKDGLIESINGEKAPKEPAKSADPKPAASDPSKQAADPIQTQLDAQAKEIADLKDSVAQMQAAINASAEKEQSMSEDFSNQMKELNNTLKVLAKIPAEFSKTSDKNQVKDEKEQKLKDLALLLGRK